MREIHEQKNHDIIYVYIYCYYYMLKMQDEEVAI